MKKRIVNLETDYEQIMPIVARLTDKYTSKNSSSVSYETAEMLTEAVIYTVEECFGEDGKEEKEENWLRQSRESRDMGCFYEEGKQVICRKVQKAKELYEEIIEDFQDYGCVNYADTVRKGFPAFFTKYDYLFCPQNHILTLDYPTIAPREELTGVDLVLEYLKGIFTETVFLNHFSADWVRQCIMEQAEGESGGVFLKHYMGNICEVVLWRVVCCIIAEKNVWELKLEAEDMAEVRFFFAGDTVLKAQQKIEAIIRILISKMWKEESVDFAEAYFCKAAHEYAVRIVNNDTTDTMNTMKATCQVDKDV